MTNIGLSGAKAFLAVKLMHVLHTSSGGRNGNMSSRGLDSKVPSGLRNAEALGQIPCVGETFTSQIPGPSALSANRMPASRSLWFSIRE